MLKKIRIAILVAMFLFSVTNVFADEVKVGKYVAGDSRNDLDYDYWIELRADQTAVLAVPGGSASGTWRHDGSYDGKIYITINTAYGELASIRGQTLEFFRTDGTGTVLYGEGDAWWLQ
jgi:hypothetical protein